MIETTTFDQTMYFVQRIAAVDPDSAEATAIYAEVHAAGLTRQVSAALSWLAEKAAEEADAFRAETKRLFGPRLVR